MVTFQKEVKEQEQIFPLHEASTLKVAVTEDKTVDVMGSLDNINFFNITGIKDLGFDFVDQITTKGTYTYDISNFEFIKIKKQDVDDQVVIAGE